MTPPRSVAASVVALGFAGALTAPLPALAQNARCTSPGSHAAQSSAQVLRINRLELGAVAEPAPRSTAAEPAPRSTAAEPAPRSTAADPAPRSTAEPGDRGTTEGEPKTPPAISGVALGDVRSVLIAGGEIKSAAAARTLDGRVSGGSRNDLVLQQAPPDNRTASRQRVSTKRFGPLRTGPGTLTAHARWNNGLACASVTGESSESAAALNRVTLTGGGNQSLVRVPEAFSATSSTGLRKRDGETESVSTTTLNAGKISLVDGEVRLRVLRAATLRVSMSSGGRGEAAYEPAVVEITTREGERTLLDTPGDRHDITLSDPATPPESLPSLLPAADPLPLPSIPGVPAAPESENAPAPTSPTGAKLHISLGAARQATKGKAIAARATAIKISLVRGDDGPATTGHQSSAVVADLSLGVLDGAAVAPKRSTGHPSPPAAPGSPGVSPAGAAGLPITGPGLVPLLLAGSGMVIGGVCAFLLSSHRRREF
ncbi:hypothetical protein AB0F72_12790 [Actinoplanes sp. NPDC023936]|uniref:hypothetical protein n=1 Tax=Actinoplanes sp. NPDC023936 TaxID=3154910 RepID=UPI0033C14380